MFHLQILFTVHVNGGKKVIMAERNEVVNIGFMSESEIYKKGADLIDGPTLSPMKSPSLQQAADLAQQYMTNHYNQNIWRYDPITNNCQKFVQSFLNANGWNSPKLESFVSQKVDTLLPGYAHTIGRAVTDLGATVDRVLHGGKLKAKRRRLR